MMYAIAAIVGCVVGVVGGAALMAWLTNEAIKDIFRNRR